MSGVNFDGCDEKTGDLLEAKANIAHLFDDNNQLKLYVNLENDPKLQMIKQADTALFAGRKVVWHAQTPKGFRGLSEIRNVVNRPNLFVVYDPN